MYFLQTDLKRSKRSRPWIFCAAQSLKSKTVGVGGKTITGSHGITVTADIEEKDVTTDDMELMILPGGMPGTLNLEKSPIVTTCAGILRKERHLSCGNLRCTERSRPSRPPRTVRKPSASRALRAS